MRKRFWVLGVGALAAFCVAVSAARVSANELVLVENGVSQAPVVVFENAPPKTRAAADQLAEYIEKISGARPQVLEGRPDPLPDGAIWVGYQPVLEEVFPGLDFDFQHPEEILLAANDGHVVIAGRDRWHPDHLVVPGRNREIVGKQQEYGTVNAVYTFLRDQLGVRWLWPGPTGEDIVETGTIAIAPFEHRHRPTFRQRGEIMRLSALADSRGISQEWTRFQRMQLDSLFVPGGHGFTTWWDRFGETHPEFFAMQPDGQRSGFPGPRTVKMCVSNPGVWRQWLDDVGEQLERDPTKNVFNASFNDSAHRGHCVCPNCLAWDNPEAPRRRLSWQGLSQDYLALTDRDVTFANKLADMLKEQYPDKEYYVMVMAYGPTRPAPVGVAPKDNVIIGNVANMMWSLEATDRMDLEGKTAAEQFAEWARVAKNIVWRPNTGNPAGWQQGQPDVALARLAESFRYAADNNCIGMFIDTTWEFWPTQGPMYYLMAHLAWDAQTDWRALMADYYQRGFGPAADEVAAYWGLIEEARNRKVDEDLSYGDAYDADFFARADGLLDTAESRLDGAPDKYAERVAFLRAGLEFTRLMVDTRTQMARYRASEGTDKDAADQVRANWVEKERIARANLMNFRSIQPGGRYARGLHPDHD